MPDIVVDPKVAEAQEEERFKQRLKDKYGIEDDPDTYKSKREAWVRAEQENPQYQATLSALIQNYRELEAKVAKEPVRQAANPEEEEERLRLIARHDPYEGAKRLIQKYEKTFDEKLAAAKEEGVKEGQRAITYRDVQRQSREMVEQSWPEAFDQNSELHKEGRRIFHTEMTPQEQRAPNSFLIATERAAGRIGLAPKGKRSSSSRRADVSAQNVSRSGVQAPAGDDDEAPLTPRQKHIASEMNLDPKVYKLAMQNRKKAKKTQDDEE